MTILEESNLRFLFNDDYEIISSNEEINIQKVKKYLQGTKDIDFLGFYSKNKVFFMEVKNFKNVMIEEINVLTNEVAHKLRDMVAIIAGASRNTTNNIDFWKKLHQAIGNYQKEIIFIFWLEEDIQNNNPRAKNRMKIITDTLKQKCKWLTTKILVQSMKNNSLEGVKIELIALQKLI